MPRLQELPDSLAKPLTLNPPSSPTLQTTQPPNLLPSSLTQQTTPQTTPFPLPPETNGATSTTPSLPPQMSSIKTRSVDEVLELMNRTPLFMTSLDETDGAGGENVELEALRALQYEGSKVEVAQGFRERGNEMARAGKWGDGKEFYGKGIMVLGQKMEEDTKEEDAEKRRQIEEACYINRALCNLELSTQALLVLQLCSTLIGRIENYRSCTLDCAATLRLNPGNIKAYYRSAQALLALDKVGEAEDACAHGLAIEPSNTALKALQTKISARKDVLDGIERKRRERAERAKKERLYLQAAFKARGIRTRSTGQPPEMEDAAIRLTPDPVSPKSTLTFPVVLLYPLHLQSDFIKAFSETDTLSSHLDYILPLPWDERKEYSMDSVEGYMETLSGGLIKVGKKVSLLKMLSSGKVEIVDDIVRISVVPKASAEGWIEEVKKRKRAAP
ncbi:MAG: hypothetical protein M1830_000273 [Pleopsidium flavum]|nr:MAG: hypothetical protein M1830_000273 [Pleopsidium flavum]